MKSEVYQSLNIWKEDYRRLLKRKGERPGMSLAGLIHEALDKSEPQPRSNNGKFKTRRANNAD